MTWGFPLYCNALSNAYTTLTDMVKLLGFYFAILRQS